MNVFEGSLYKLLGLSGLLLLCPSHKQQVFAVCSIKTGLRPDSMGMDSYEWFTCPGVKPEEILSGDIGHQV